MADEPKELQLYQVRYNSPGSGHQSIFHTSVAIKGSTSGSMDEARELAEAVRDKINDDTGMDYQLIFLNCIGTIYVWKKG